MMAHNADEVRRADVKTGEMQAIYKIVRGREIAALLNPRPAVLVTCCDADGTPNALSLVWHTPLSHDPTLVGISVAKSRYSYGLIEESGEFVINIVSAACQHAVEVCGQRSGRDGDKLGTAGLRLEPARTVRPPLIAGALGALECRVVDRLSCGDHMFFVGEVLSATARAGCFGDAWEPGLGEVLLSRQRDRFGTCTPGEG